MTVALVSAAIQLGTALLGLAASIALIRAGEPRNGRPAGSTPTWEKLRSRLPLIGFNLGMIVVGTTVFLGLHEDRFTLDWPHPIVLLAQVVFVFAVEDAVFYAWHRALHRNKTLYKRIHRIHHQAWAPLPIEYIYVHPVEWMVPAAAPALALVALNVAQGGLLSAWVFWTYLLLRQLHELAIHGTSSLVPRVPLPLIGSPEAHALHHAKPTLGQYASIFSVWDRVFGTTIPR